MSLNTRYLEIFVARLSLWQNGRHSNDYRFFDRRISEIYTISGTGVNVHKYLGPISQPATGDATQPTNANQSELNIQDLLFLENRDRKYEENVYVLRGMYQVQDEGFDLSQFGLFLQTGTVFMTFHLNDMIASLGRKIMNGDVLELQHLLDYETLDPGLPAALKRFFVVSDCTRAAEGYSPTWWPHLWRVKLNPLVDSQEYRDILDRIQADEAGTSSLREVLSTYDKYISINDSVVTQAEVDVPYSGYDTTPIYHRSGTEVNPDYTIQGYLTGNGVPPNGQTASSATSFPANPSEGDYVLRVDFLPNRLFRWDGRRWVKIEDAVRNNYTRNTANNRSQIGGFITNTATFTDVNGDVQPQKQNLSDILKPKAD
jgi:hypothetical protein